MSVRLECGDCLDVMLEMAAAGEQFDALVSDPPYHLTSVVKRFGGENAKPAQFGKDGLYARQSRGFMQREWDGGDIAFRPETWRLAYDVLKPGAHLLAFGGTRTSHRMAVAIEDAGFELRDTVMWVYGSGFPKSHDVSKGIDARGGSPHLTAEIGAALKKSREARNLSAGECDRLFCAGSSNWSWFEGRPRGQRAPMPDTFKRIVAAWPELAPLAASVDEAARETIRMAAGTRLVVNPGAGEDRGVRTIGITAPATPEAAAWQGWGTALKPAWEPIIMARKPLAGTVAANVLQFGTGALNIDASRIPGLVPVHERTANRTGANSMSGTSSGSTATGEYREGRWPANVIHDASDDVLEAFAAYGESKPKAGRTGIRGGSNAAHMSRAAGDNAHQLSKGAWPADEGGTAARFFYSAKASAADRAGSKHPTVKPLALMRYLCRLVTPPGGTILDPFSGSGTTLQAAAECGFNAVGVEREAEYQADILRRIAALESAELAELCA